MFSEFKMKSFKNGELSNCPNFSFFYTEQLWEISSRKLGVIVVVNNARLRQMETLLIASCYLGRTNGQKICILRACVMEEQCHNHDHVSYYRLYQVTK